MQRMRVVMLFASVLVISFGLGCGILTDAFSCKDEEERFNKADAAWDRGFIDYNNGVITASQWSDIKHEYAEAQAAYRKCKD